MIMVMAERCPVIFHQMEDVLNQLQDYILSVRPRPGGKHIHFNTLSSGKETLETGMICNSEEHFQNPSSIASSKLYEKCSQCNKAEILTTKVKMHRTGDRELNYSSSLKRNLGKRTALATANTTTQGILQRENQLGHKRLQVSQFYSLVPQFYAQLINVSIDKSCQIPVLES